MGAIFGLREGWLDYGFSEQRYFMADGGSYFYYLAADTAFWFIAWGFREGI